MNGMTTIFANKSRLRWLERALMLVAVVCLGAWGWAWLDSAYTQYRDNQILDEALNAAPQAAPAAAGSSAAETDSLGSFRQANAPEPPKPMEPGALVGRIEIPRIGVSAIVLEGVDSKTLRRGVGHIPETPLPGGNGGNVGLAAHRDSFFRGLKDIRKNDIIQVRTLEGDFRYRVESTQIVKPEDTEVLDDGPVPMLTLVTCYPFYYVGSAPKRFIVHAQRIEDGAAM